MAVNTQKILTNGSKIAYGVTLEGPFVDCNRHGQDAAPPTEARVQEARVQESQGSAGTTAEPLGSRVSLPRMSEGNVTKFALHFSLTSTARGRLTFAERVVLHCVDRETQMMHYRFPGTVNRGQKAVRPTTVQTACLASLKPESGPLRAVHFSRHKWPGGGVNR